MQTFEFEFEDIQKKPATKDAENITLQKKYKDLQSNVVMKDYKNIAKTFQKICRRRMRQ